MSSDSNRHHSYNRIPCNDVTDEITEKGGEEKERKRKTEREDRGKEECLGTASFSINSSSSDQFHNI